MQARHSLHRPGWLVAFFLLASGLLPGTHAVAQQVTLQDCKAISQSYQLVLNGVRERFSQCFNREWTSPAGGNPRAYSYETSCYGKTFASCGPVKQQECNVMVKQNRAVRSCYANNKLFFALQREQEDLEAELRRKGREQLAADERDRQIQQRRLRMSRLSESAVVGGHLAGRALGVPSPRIGSSYYLSNAISASGGRLVERIHRLAREELDAALGRSPSGGSQYSASNPRPSGVSAERLRNAVFAMRFHANRSGQSTYRLPLGQSAVGTSAGQHLGEVVRRHIANGGRGSLQSTYEDYVASAGAPTDGITRAIDESAAGNWDAQDLAEERRQALAVTERERERLAKEAKAAQLAAQRRAERRKKTNRRNETTVSAGGGDVVPACTGVTRLSPNLTHYSFKGGCGRDVACAVFERRTGNSSGTKLFNNANIFHADYRIVCRL